MNNEQDIERIAFDLGQRAVDQAASAAADFCAWERRSIEAALEPEQLALRSRLALLRQVEAEHRQILQLLPVDTAVRESTLYYWALVIFMFVGGFSLAYATLAPFGFGSATWAISLGVSALPMVCTHEFLKRTANFRILLVFCIVSFATSLAALLAVAALRGEVFAYYLRTAVANTADASNSLAFYSATVPLLQAIFALLAVAMDLAGGMALHEVLRPVPSSHADRARVWERIMSIGEEQIDVAQRFLENANKPKVMEAKVMSAFYRGVLGAARSVCRSVVAPAFFAALIELPCFGQPRVIEAIDLSASMATSGYRGMNESQHSFAALAESIRTLPAGTQLTILGITAESFSRPTVLLSRQLPLSAGRLAFLDQVELAKNGICAEIEKLRQSTPANATHSDILGLLVYVAALFREMPLNEKVLVIRSDMRHTSSAIDLESPAVIDAARELHRIERHSLLADLPGVDVYVQGVHAAGKSVRYWRSLREFWLEYFRRSGANIKSFSMTNGAPRIWQQATALR